MEQPSNTYINADGKHESPARSQERGNYQKTYESYNVGQNNRGSRNSTLPGIPYVGAGVMPSALQPKAWIGARGVFNLNAINGGKIESKINNATLTVRGGLTIANKVQDIFPGDEARDPNNINNYYNYIFNRGGGPLPLSSGIYDLPQVGDSAYVSSNGDDLLEDGSESEYALDKRWCFVLAVSPEDLLGGFFASKGHTDSSNCQVAIWSDGTNVYRTIGGSDRVVDTVANIISTSEHVVLQLFNVGDTGTPFDSFAVNDQVIWTEENTNRGAVTSTLPMMIGGIHSSATPGSASTSNAKGHYRLFVSYNSDRLTVKENIDWLSVAHYVNYTCSPLAIGDGDSVMNSYAPDIDDRIDGFWFRTEFLLNQNSTTHILFANAGTSGAGTSQKVPDDFAYPANQYKNITYNNIMNNVKRFCQEFMVDFFGLSCMINEFAGKETGVIPYSWLDTVQLLQMMHRTCSKYGVVFMHNTNFTVNEIVNSEPEFPILALDVNDGITSHTSNTFDWHTLITNQETGFVYSVELQQDSAHPSKRAHHAIALRMLVPQFAGYLYTIKAIYPDAT